MKTKDRFDVLTEGLQILWYESMELEIIPLHVIESGSPGPVETIGKYTSGTDIHYYFYEAILEHTEDSVIRIDYNEPPKEWEGTEWQIEFGSTEIHLDKNGEPSSVFWKGNDSSTVKLEKNKDWIYVRSQEPFGRVKISRSVLNRPDQSALRKILISEVGQCLLTGCDLHACLDAAHIVPVKSGGRDSTSNTILLRSDMHRLFDAGLLCLKFSHEGLEIMAAECVRHYVLEQMKNYNPCSYAARHAEALNERYEKYPRAAELHRLVLNQ